jgi:hypothetical protein
MNADTCIHTVGDVVGDCFNQRLHLVCECSFDCLSSVHYQRAALHSSASLTSFDQHQHDGLACCVVVLLLCCGSTAACSDDLHLHCN